jgi:hypothetical protein
MFIRQWSPDISRQVVLIRTFSRDKDHHTLDHQIRLMRTRFTRLCSLDLDQNTHHDQVHQAVFSRS